MRNKEINIKINEDNDIYELTVDKVVYNYDNEDEWPKPISLLWDELNMAIEIT